MTHPAYQQQQQQWKQQQQQPRRDTAVLDLIQFAVKAKIQFAKCRPQAMPPSGPALPDAPSARGMFSTQPVQKGDALISVPRPVSLTICPDEPVPAALAKQLPASTWSQLPWYAQVGRWVHRKIISNDLS